MGTYDEAKNRLESTEYFFKEYKELDGLFKKYGFDKEKDLILVDHIHATESGLRTYFRINEALVLLNADRTDTISFYIGAHREIGQTKYEIDKISIVLCRNVEMQGVMTPVPFASKHYHDWEWLLPTRAQIYADAEQFLKIKQIREKFNIGSDQSHHALNAKSTFKRRP
jgi:hypothetical protein